jgi:hypothetical protein
MLKQAVHIVTTVLENIGHYSGICMERMRKTTNTTGRIASLWANNRKGCQPLDKHQVVWPAFGPRF